MKSNILRMLSILLCLALVLTMFAGCKGKNEPGEDEVSPADVWSQGVPTDKVEITAEEFETVVKAALGSEAESFDGTISSLTPEQLSKLQNYCAENGYYYEASKDGDIKILKSVALVNVADSSVLTLVDEALGDDADSFDGDLSKLTDDQLDKVKKAADDKGLYVVTDDDGTHIKKEDRSINATEDDKDKVDEIVKDVLGKDAKGFDWNTDKLSDKKKNELEKALADQDLTPQEAESIQKKDYGKPTTTTTRANGGKTGGGSSGGGKSNGGSSGGSNSTTAAPLTVSGTFSSEELREVIKWDTAWISGNDAGQSSFSACDATNDGGMVAVGTSEKDNKHHGTVVKYDSKGKIDWKKTIEDDDNLYLEDVEVLKDGSIVAVGYTIGKNLSKMSPRYLSGDAPKGNYDSLIAKYSPKGSLDYILIFGGSGSETLDSVAQCSDGSIVVGGSSKSTDGDFSAVTKLPVGQQTSAYIIKFTDDTCSKIAWAKSTTSSKYASVEGLATNDKGDIFAAYRIMAPDYEFSSIPNASIGSEKTLAVKYTASGSTSWQQTLCSSGRVEMTSIIADSDGGCTLAGYYSAAAPTEENNLGRQGTFSEFYNGGNAGSADGAVIKLKADGTINWINVFVGFYVDFIRDIVAIPTGYLICGSSNSTNRDFAGMMGRGDNDAFIYALGHGGGKQTIYPLGGSDSDKFLSLCVMKDGSVGAVGNTSSNDKDFSALDPAPSNGTASFAVKAEYTLS